MSHASDHASTLGYHAPVSAADEASIGLGEMGRDFLSVKRPACSIDSQILSCATLWVERVHLADAELMEVGAGTRGI
jgi:hypothetical protein